MCSTDRLLILLEGSVAIYSEDATLLATLPEEGSTDAAPPVLGENAVLSTDPHTLTVRTLTPVKLLSLPRSKFHQLLAALPDIKGALRRLSMLREATLSAARQQQEE